MFLACFIADEIPPDVPTEIKYDGITHIELPQRHAAHAPAMCLKGKRSCLAPGRSTIQSVLVPMLLMIPCK